MEKNYIKEYERYSDLFYKHFGEEAENYWKIFVNHYFDNVSYEKLAKEYNYSVSTIGNIIKRVANFFEDPSKIMREEEYSFERLNGNIYISKEFASVNKHLSLAANKLLYEAIYLYQHGMNQKIPRSHVLHCAPQFKNVDRRAALIEELRNCSIFISYEKSVNLFEKNEDEKGAVRFEFTEECLKYIDPFYAF